MTGPLAPPRRRAPAAVVALVALLAVPAAAVAGPAVKGADLELLEAVRRVAGQVAAMRGEAFRRPPVAVRAPGPLLDVATEIAAHRTLSSARLEARGRAWRDVGLGDVEDPGRISRLLALDLSGIAWDPTQRRLLISPRTLTAEDPADPTRRRVEHALLMTTGVRLDEPLVAHGLTHVLQAERGADTAAETTDGILARAAWREGEATLVAMKILYDGMGIGDEVLTLGPDPQAVLSGALFPDGLDRIPGVPGELARWVYLDGFLTVTGVYLDGGFPAVVAAANAGRTTRGVIHPGREAAPAPIETPAAPPGTGVVDADRLGEQAIVALISGLTGKDNLALMAADGWVGDGLWRFEGDDPQRGSTIWRTRWTDDAEAAEFVYAYLRGLEEAGRDVSRAEDGSSAVAALGGRTLRVERSGAAVDVSIVPVVDGSAPAGH